MKYMVIMSGTKKRWDWFSSRTKEHLMAQVAFMRQFSKSPIKVRQVLSEAPKELLA